MVDSKISRLRDLGVGDTIFVANQNSRWEKRQDLPRETSTQTITRVGRKYAYFQDGREEKKFDRKTGVSWHSPDSNARANGYGFDVYLDEQTYAKTLHEQAEAKRLQTRLVGSFGQIYELSPSAVQRIHQILDEEGIVDGRGPRT